MRMREEYTDGVLFDSQRVRLWWAIFNWVFMKLAKFVSSIIQ